MSYPDTCNNATKNVKRDEESEESAYEGANAGRAGAVAVDDGAAAALVPTVGLQ